MENNDLSQSEILGNRPVSFVDIINKSDFPILYKVKTTNLKNYQVKPNSEAIPSMHQVRVKIVCMAGNFNNLRSDKFLF